MNVSLTEELEKLVEQKLASGLYTSASEVVREGLRLLHERDQLRDVRLDELRKEISKGVASARAGKLVDGEPFMEELLQAVRKRTRKAE